ncbi:DNA adenine methylase [candidate division KSB3 bacterium]|uniref:DNA adenine methylase n=1 Tax=candidate division KSB3 bacterium TaxID=2044937 RepID=A0A9D5Q702_9BACT|nr:DNA adenine methylase [candidate division KSB3 bacterium]MBD3326340.1 DNA adenine methylase [candidate division KSB3 bacterium]
MPHRSPFRYPGGKTWLVPRIRQWLARYSSPPQEFIELFAGGAIVGLSVAFEQLAQHVTLVEIDPKVGAVWQAIIEEGKGLWLAEAIEQFHFTPTNVQEILSQSPASVSKKALQTIIHNRVSRGGILAKGAGLVKYGEKGKGLASRWYPQTLSKRIRAIHAIRDRLSFILGDGIEVIHQYRQNPEAVFFIDPPYTAGNGKRAGRRLYDYCELDHQYLFEVMSQIQGDFLLTYDTNSEVLSLARQHDFDTKMVAMKSTHHANMTELLISQDLSWCI